MRLLLGIFIGWALNAVPALALRMQTAPTFTETWDSNSISQLNYIIEQLRSITNGRYQVNITTSDPDGTVRGERGELILYDPGATESLCVNVDGAKDWDCEELEA